MIEPAPLFLRRATEATSSVKSGSFVSWPASKGTASGVVVSVHKTKQVPGVPHLQEATAEAPAARVQLYAQNGDGWEPTSVFLGLPTSSLSGIDPLPAVAVEEPATEAVAGSFDEIREQVRSAIVEQIEEATGVCPDLWLYDLGPTWAVYCVGYNYGDDDLRLVEYSLGAGGSVMLGTPISVRPVTQYQPITEGSAVEARALGETLSSRVLEAAGEAADGGRVFRVLMIKYGDSKNGRRYPEAVMRAAAPLFEGAKAYDHHRTESELTTSTIAGLVGTYRNVTATAVGLEADLHLLPSASHTAEAFDMALANQAEGLEPLIGLSQDVLCTWRSVSEAGRLVQEAVAVVAVNSVDVVAHPAAGGMATRMVASAAPGTVPASTLNPPKETTVFPLQQLIALLRTTEAADRAALVQTHIATVNASGLTTADVLRLAEAAAPAATPATEAVTPAATVLSKASLMGRSIIRQAVEAANLDLDMVDAIAGELPDHFTESDVVARVESTLRVVESLERRGLAPSIRAREGVVTVGEGELEKKQGALDAMLAGNFREGYHSLKQAYLDIAGMLGGRAVDPFSEDLNRTILRESVSLRVAGERTPFDSSLRATESVQSTTWGFMLGDSITRRMVAEYAQPDLQQWRAIVSSIVPVADFRSQKIERMGGYGLLPAVNQGAPYNPLTSPGNDAEPNYAVTKRGGTEDLTLEAITNDDVRAVQRIPQKLGLAAAQTLFRFVFDNFANNPNIYDGVALFAAGHNNTAATALSGGNLSLARRNMRKQTAYGDATDLLSIVPKFLLVCSDLEELAFELATSSVALPAGAPVGGAANTPNLHQGITPIVIDYWTSTTAWYPVADPSKVPTIEIGFLQGQEDPALFVQNDSSNGSVFNADKVTWKIRHIYSGTVVDYRGFYRGNS